MPAGDVFGLDGFFLNVSNPVVVSTIGINSTAAGAGIAVTAGTFSAGTVTLNLSNAAGLTTTPFYTGAKIAVSGLSTAGVAYTGYNGTFNVTGFAGTTTVSYATTGYVGGVTAGITTTGLVILVSDTQVTNTTWSSAQTHGWWGGGATPTIVSAVDRIDFSNDTGTANTRGPLSLARTIVAATGNSNYGWFAVGGTTNSAASAVSTVDRIDFSNDSATASIRNALSSVKFGAAATGNSNYGWFGGGAIESPRLSTVDRIDFSNDSGTASPRGPLFQARQFVAATGNSNYGWWGGGRNPSPTSLSTVDRIDFSNDSATASPRGPLSAVRGYTSATGNSNYGWFGGGLAPGVSTRLATVDRIDFSNDLALSSPRGPLSSARSGLTATGNSNYGWFGGGSIPELVSTVDRIDFSNDLAAVSVRGPLSSARGYSGATSGQARSSSIRLQKGGNFGWFGGGAPAPIITVDRINFSNDSVTASVRGPLSSERLWLASTGNSNYGWFGGGQTPSISPSLRSTVDRIDFSNDSATLSLRGPLSLGRSTLSATGNSNYGWFGGGGPSATVDRIDFSNDSATASVRGSLFGARNYAVATGNSNYGWIGSGFNPPTPLVTVNRIDFSNDLAAASPRGSLNIGRFAAAATGNSNYGWFGGGSPGPLASVERIDFSNDSTTASPRGSFNLPKYGPSATGNSNYGWFGGAGFPTADTVDRIDFSNNSVTASPRGRLSAARYSMAATSNSTR